jgi:hypothetical protein
VLLLMPAAVLVVLVLASIAVDFTVAFAGEGIHLDEDRARRIALSTLGASSTELDDLEVEVVVGDLAGEPSVTVTVRGTIDYVFARALPGAPTEAAVEATATAVARAG